MIYKNFSDCHNHSNFSYDAIDSLEDMCKKATELGMLYYGCSDHCECNEYTKDINPYNTVVQKSYDETIRLKEIYPFLLGGIELGQPLQDLTNAKHAIKDRSFDFIIGSLHNVKGEADFYYWDKQTPKTKEDIDYFLNSYFNEILEMLNWGQFDSLAHLTYPLRYIKYPDGTKVTFDPYMDYVEAIFKKLIQKGIALELNTSGLRQTIGETLPNNKLLDFYKRLGGELITIGSDAHNLNDLGKGINEGLTLLKNLNFKHFTIYKNRKPIMLNIE